MTRGLLIAVKIAVVVALGVYLANHPGRATIEWFGWRIEDAPVGLLVLAAVLLAVVVALLYRFWRFLYRAPQSIGRKLEDNRRRRGYKALSNGMVAVAAGDAGEAARWARRADDLLEDPPLTLLLSAQAAQLSGDEGAAKRYFEAMLDNPETRFLGLRGLVMQAMRDGDDAQALEYLRQAKRLRPKTPWVLTSLFQVGERTGALDEAEAALKTATKVGALPAPEGRAKRALLQLKKALAAEQGGQLREAWQLAKAARKLAPEHRPTTLTAALLALVAGSPRDAQKIAEDAWAAAPHPELARLHREAQREVTPVDYVKRLPRLTSRNPSHPESHLAIAEAALAAELWGQARTHLELAGNAAPSVRVCHLMADLERNEHGDGEAARQWLERALTAPPDPAWLCDACGARAPDWSLHCRVCDGLDSLTWRPPKQAELAGPSEAPLIEETAEKPSLPAAVEREGELTS